MAISTVDISTPSGLKKYRNTDIAEVKDGVDSTSGKLHSIVVDNTANAGAASFLKLWDLAVGSVTVGTTVPDYIVKIPAATKSTIIFHDGLAYGTALTVACLTAAGTAGTTGPTSDVIVEIIFET
jgi:hypothetical protein